MNYKAAIEEQLPKSAWRKQGTCLTLIDRCRSGAFDEVNRCHTIGLVVITLARIGDDPIVGGHKPPSPLASLVFVNVVGHRPEQ
jgi:hypothetical protein